VTHVIELNDAGVTLATDAGILVESPGFAIVDARRMAVGEPALREARRDPRHTVNQFWQRLSTDSLQTTNPRARTQADLAHAHLLHLWEAVAHDDDEVIFAIPGHYGREQLALLLGIARECPFRAVGLVDAAIAASAAVETPSGLLLHLDSHLHRTTVTRIRGDDMLARDAVDDLPAVGLVSLRDAWVNLIADAFIRETRFDPLHDAGTEQKLYDHLDGWLAAFETATEVPIELDTGRHVYRVALERELLVARVAARYDTLIAHLKSELDGATHATVLVSERLARLPGLLDAIGAAAEFTPLILARDAAARGVLGNEARIRGEGDALAFVTRLPRGTAQARGPASTPSPRTQEAPPAAAAEPSEAAAPAPRAPLRAAAGRRAPTHLLLGATAYPLGDRSLTIGGPGGLGEDLLDAPQARLEATDTGWMLDPLVEDAVRADGAPLHEPTPMVPGQRLTIGDRHLRMELIRVLPSDAGAHGNADA
jgi:hypothetical protein